MHGCAVALGLASGDVKGVLRAGSCRHLYNWTETGLRELGKTYSVCQAEKSPSACQAAKSDAPGISRWIGMQGST